MLTAATIAAIGGWATAATATAAVAGTAVGISRARSAAKKAKGQAEQAERVRAQERARITAPATAAKPGLVAQAEVLPEVAKKEAASIAAGRRRKRTTLATGPRGLLTEPTVTKPALLGA